MFATMQMLSSLIHPFSQIVAALELCRDLVRLHRLVLAKIFGVFPLKKLDPIFCVWLSSEMTVCGSLLVFGLPECQRHRYGTWAAIEVDFDDVGDVICGQSSLLC